MMKRTERRRRPVGAVVGAVGTKLARYHAASLLSTQSPADLRAVLRRGLRLLSPSLPDAVPILPLGPRLVHHPVGVQALPRRPPAASPTGRGRVVAGGWRRFSSPWRRAGATRGARAAPHHADAPLCRAEGRVVCVPGECEGRRPATRAEGGKRHVQGRGRGDDKEIRRRREEEERRPPPSRRRRPARAGQKPVSTHCRRSCSCSPGNTGCGGSPGMPPPPETELEPGPSPSPGGEHPRSPVRAEPTHSAPPPRGRCRPGRPRSPGDALLDSLLGEIEQDPMGEPPPTTRGSAPPFRRAPRRGLSCQLPAIRRAAAARPTCRARRRAVWRCRRRAECKRRRRVGSRRTQDTPSGSRRRSSRPAGRGAAVLALRVGALQALRHALLVARTDESPGGRSRRSASSRRCATTWTSELGRTSREYSLLPVSPSSSSPPRVPPEHLRAAAPRGAAALVLLVPNLPLVVVLLPLQPLWQPVVAVADALALRRRLDRVDRVVARRVVAAHRRVGAAAVGACVDGSDARPRGRATPTAPPQIRATERAAWPPPSAAAPARRGRRGEAHQICDAVGVAGVQVAEELGPTCLRGLRVGAFPAVARLRWPRPA